MGRAGSTLGWAQHREGETAREWMVSPFLSSGLPLRDNLVTEVSLEFQPPQAAVFVLGQCGAMKSDSVGMTERGQLCHGVSRDAYTPEGPD